MRRLRLLWAVLFAAVAAGAEIAKPAVLAGLSLSGVD